MAIICHAEFVLVLHTLHRPSSCQNDSGYVQVYDPMLLVAVRERILGHNHSMERASIRRLRRSRLAGCSRWRRFHEMMQDPGVSRPRGL